MPACAPVRETALAPIAFRAIAVRAMVVCSPVESSTSISRSVGSASPVTSLASLMRLLVTPDIAETTATTWFPASLVARMRRATLRMRSGVPTDVPPYFWTIRLTRLMDWCSGGETYASGSPFVHRVSGDRQSGINLLVAKTSPSRDIQKNLSPPVWRSTQAPHRGDAQPSRPRGDPSSRLSS